MRVRHTIPAIVSGIAALSCGFADLFNSSKIGDVAVTYNGPTVLSIGDTVPVSVTVTTGGTPLTDARLWITTSDPNIIALSARSDTLFALDRGFDTLTIRVVASIFTDTFPTIVQAIRVNP